MFGVSALAVLLRRERSEVAGLVLLTLLIAFTAFFAAAGLRLFERASDDGLRREVGGATVLQRTVQLTNTRPVFDAEAARPISDWQADGERLRGMLPEALNAATAEGSVAITSPRLSVTNPPVFPIFVNVRHQDNFEDLVELTEGRWPTGTGEEIPPVVEVRLTDDGRPYTVGTAEEHILDPPRRFEIALQEETSRELGLPLGHQLTVNVDYTDLQLSNSILGRADVFLAPTILEVTGLYRVKDPDSDGWFGDPRLRIDDLGNTGMDLEPGPAYVTAYVSEDGIPGIITSGLPFEYRWRYPIQADLLDAERVADISRGLQLLETRPPTTETIEEVTAQAGLLPLLERHDSLLSASRAILALAAGAPLALAGAAIAIAAVMLARRRRSTMIIARGRGASKRLLLAASVFEAALVAMVAGLIGLGLAVAVVPSAELTPSLLAVLAIGIFAVVVLIGAALPHIRQPLDNLERGSRPSTGMNPRRIVAELTVVGVALVGAYVLRQRGLGAISTGFDPFLAAVPPLIGVAAVFGAVRLYPPVVAGAGWLATRRRDLVPVLGIRTVARGAASSMPALVLVLAVAFAAFASIVVASIDRAQEVASWVTVGADARVESTRSDLLSEMDPTAISGIDASATGYAQSGIRAPAGVGVGTLALLAIDPQAYSQVVAGSPIEPRWPQQLTEQPTDGPLPAIVGGRLTGGQTQLGRGDTFDILVQGHRVELEIVDVRAGIQGLTSSDAFVVVPTPWLEHSLVGGLRPNVMWIRAPETTASGLRDVSAGTAPDIEVVSRYEEHAELRNQPLLGAVGAGFVVAFVTSVAYAVLTILVAVVMSMSLRSRDLAILRTLGLHRRQQTRLSMIEHVPPILVALPMGVLLGVGVAAAVAPALGLGALSGSAGDVPLVIDWPLLIMLSIALLLLSLAAVAVGSWLARRAAIVNGLRVTSD